MEFEKETKTCSCMKGGKKQAFVCTCPKNGLKKIYYGPGSILSLYGERNKNISVASCIKGKKAFLEEKKRLPYLPSIEAGTLVGATADITAAT